MRVDATACPCGSGQTFEQCCRPYLAGWDTPKTAVALMRSRYSAYVEEDIAYLEATSGGAALAEFSARDAAAWAKNATFSRLEVHASEAGGEGDTTGIVEFSATFTEQGRTQVLHERSRFEKIAGLWKYVGRGKGKSVARETPKVGRNDPCPCGSGQKFKKCCGA